MKHDLKNATFIMPLRIESEDRLRNIVISLAYLLKNFDTNVIIQEVDTDSKFQNYAAPQLENLIDDMSSITLIYEKNDDPIFHRTRILNDMLMEAKTDVVVNYDTDVIFPPSSYLIAYDKITKLGYDLVYPYGQGEWQYKVTVNQDLINDLVNSDWSHSAFEDHDAKEKSTSDYGWAQFFNRKSYIEGGGENENFVSYGYEDNERPERFERLGYKVGRVDDTIYHMEHVRTMNSWFTNPHIENNKNLYERLKAMSPEQLKNYYDTVEYMRKRNGSK
jgi:predicted glycosyltransferase involved in capsule biosynthesis